MAKKITGESFEEQYFESQNIHEDVDGDIKNKNFVQFYDKNNIQLLELIMKDSTAAAVFMFMARYAESNNTIHISNKQLQEVLKKSESTIKRSLKTLKDLNFITTIKKGRENIYFINPQIVCNTSAKYKNKMIHLYLEYAKTTDVGHIDSDIVDEGKYLDFRVREKYIYRFALQDGGINELATDKLAQMAEKILEQEMREKDDAIMKEAEGMGKELDWENDWKE